MLRDLGTVCLGGQFYFCAVESYFEFEAIFDCFFFVVFFGSIKLDKAANGMD